jgi:Tfp pilus assembly protein FimT
MIIALALSGILGAIAIPNLAGQLPTYRLNAAARQIQSELHRIKSQAVAQNTEHRAVFLPPSSYRIERKIGTTTYASTGEIKPLPDGIIYGNASAKNISFTPRGTSTNDTIKLCNSRREGKNVVVFGGTGRIRVASERC